LAEELANFSPTPADAHPPFRQRNRLDQRRLPHRAVRQVVRELEDLVNRPLDDDAALNCGHVVPPSLLRFTLEAKRRHSLGRRAELRSFSGTISGSSSRTTRSATRWSTFNA